MRQWQALSPSSSASPPAGNSPCAKCANSKLCREHVVSAQIDAFARVGAKIAEQDDLPHDLKRELVVRAYAEFGARPGAENPGAKLNQPSAPAFYAHTGPT
jgi:hypothetical protein